MNPYADMCYFFGSAALQNAAAAYICTGVLGDDHMYHVVMMPRVSFAVLRTSAD